MQSLMPSHSYGCESLKDCSSTGDLKICCQLYGLYEFKYSLSITIWVGGHPWLLKETTVGVGFFSILTNSSESYFLKSLNLFSSSSGTHSSSPELSPSGIFRFWLGGLEDALLSKLKVPEVLSIKRYFLIN